MLNHNRNNRHDDGGLGALQELVDDLRSVEPTEAQYRRASDNLYEKLASERKEHTIMSVIFKTLQTGPARLTATGIALVLLAALIAFNPFGSKSGQVYAEFVEQLRKAQTIAFSAKWFHQNQSEPTEMELVFREPGIQRTVMEYNGAKMIQINDTEQKRGITIMPDLKSYLLTDLSKMPSNERERVELLQLVQDGFRNLPPQADAILPEKTINGRKALGYRVGNQVIWFDKENHEVVLLENNLGGTRMLMSNFRIDPDDYTDAMFEVTPPEGYTALIRQPIVALSAKPGESDLIQYLKTIAEMKKNHQFPDTTNPMEVLALKNKGQLIEDDPNADPAEQEKSGSQFAQHAQNTVMFVIQMQPANDWHYSGKNVALGDAKTPIAWWKPDNSAKYRVIWGDLRVTDESAESVAGFKR